MRECTLHAQTGHKVTSLDDLQDIDELCVVEVGTVANETPLLVFAAPVKL